MTAAIRQTMIRQGLGRFGTCGCCGLRRTVWPGRHENHAAGLCDKMVLPSKTMTREEQQRLYDLVANPPPGSKIEAAKEFGIDLMLNLRRLRLTPTERLREMEGAVRLKEEIQQAAKPPKE